MIRWAGGLYWAYAASAWCGLVAMFQDGTAMLRHEFVWRQTFEGQAVDQLTTFLKDRKIDLDYLVGQPAMFPKPKQAGPSVSEIWERGPWALYKGHDDLVAGWHRLRGWLNDDGTPPKLVIHKSCTQLIRTLPTLVSPSSHPDELDITPDVYPSLALAQWAMSRPTPGTKPEDEVPDGCLHTEIEKIRRENELALR